jgi:hypothetical protein
VKELTFQIVGFKAVRATVTDALAEILSSTDTRTPVAKLRVSREAVSLSIPKSYIGSTHEVSYAPEHLGAAFDSLYPPAVWGTLVVTGIRASRVIRALLQWQMPTRGRGSPKRAQGWHADREDFFAIVLRSIAFGTEEVTKAITHAAASHRQLFERAYQGDDPIEYARRDYYRRMKDFEGIPGAAIPLGRILTMQFEFENSD